MCHICTNGFLDLNFSEEVIDNNKKNQFIMKLTLTSASQKSQFFLKNNCKYFFKE